MEGRGGGGGGGVVIMVEAEEEEANSSANRHTRCQPANTTETWLKETSLRTLTGSQRLLPTSTNCNTFHYPNLSTRHTILSVIISRGYFSFAPPQVPSDPSSHYRKVCSELHRRFLADPATNRKLDAVNATCRK
jgi:hypothetical protein